MSFSAEPQAAWSQPADQLPATAAPSKPSPDPQRKLEKIAFLDALRFVFSNPEWLKGVVIGGLFILLLMLIPVLSQLIFFGYSYDIVERLHRRLTNSYPLFDVRQIVRYITRGVWPFVIAIIVQGILQPMIQFPVQGSVMGTMIALERDETVGTIIAAIVIPLLCIFLALLTVGLMLVLTPIMMRAGLSQDLAQTFKMNWIKDFIRRMWVETILVNLFMIFCGLVLVLPACLLFCLPGFVMAMGMTIAGANLNWQLYELYLTRGGEPIPLRPLPEEAPAVVQDPLPQA